MSTRRSARVPNEDLAELPAAPVKAPAKMPAKRAASRRTTPVTGSPSAAQSTAPLVFEPVAEPAEAVPLVFEPVVFEPSEAVPLVFEPVVEPAEAVPLVFEPVVEPAEAVPLVFEPVVEPAEAVPIAIEPVAGSAEAVPLVAEVMTQDDGDVKLLDTVDPEAILKSMVSMESEIAKVLLAHNASHPHRTKVTSLVASVDRYVELVAGIADRVNSALDKSLTPTQTLDPAFYAHSDTRYVVDKLRMLVNTAEHVRGVYARVMAEAK